jgi:hypothetical protein
MDEKILYFAWKYKLYNNKQFIDSNGQQLEIINPGTQNFDAGPDFINAKIKINDTIWAGNVEMHINASDWNKHKHFKDKAYNNVILHVVINNDKDVINENGNRVPAMELEIDSSILDKYDYLVQSEEKPACKTDLKQIEKIKLNLWFNSLLFERLNNKTEFIRTKLESTKNNWEEAFYQILARNFGFNLNAEPFERLARSLPLKYLAKHQNNLFQIEALLFGQAGFLHDNINDDYFIELKREYTHLQKKFSLKPIEKYSWKFLRSRPSNFPTVRIAQFAMLIFKSKSLFSKIIDANNAQEIKKMFQLKTSAFWSNHYTFEKVSAKKEKSFGSSSIDNIIINTIVPFTFLYGEFKDKQTLKDKSINLLETLKAENNHITKIWQAADITINSAFLSQALIQQTKNYCQKEKCLDCGIGSEILRNSFINQTKFNR